MKMLKESTRIIRFAIIGMMNALITAIVVVIFMEMFDRSYLFSNVLGYIAGQINNFFWSKYWVFSSSQGKFRQEIPLFLFAFATAYLTQFLFLIVTIEWCGLNEYLGQFLGLFIYGSINFIMNRKVTFKRR